MSDNGNSEDDLPKHIKFIRQYLGLSQEELAQKLGVSFTSVNRWENGQTKPSKLARRQIDTLCKKNEKLLDALGVTCGN
jgi:DNA-binding transcriptional regulator YiaG